MSALRRAIPDRALAERNRRLCERIVLADWFEQAHSIGLFWPMAGRNEVDLRTIDARARALDKRLFYPFMADAGAALRTGFRLVDDPAELAERGRGFLEPLPDAPEAERGDLDVILVPALAVARDGHRLGYGAGFYDATLPDFAPPARSVIVAFDFQLLGELPTAEHDFACDRVVTDARELECARAPL